MVRWGRYGHGLGLNFGVWKGGQREGDGMAWVGGIFDIYGVLCRRHLRDQITKYVSSCWVCEGTINWLPILLWGRFKLIIALRLAS